MTIMKATKDSQAWKMSSEELIATTGSYNEELAKAEILIDAAGLPGSSKTRHRQPVSPFSLTQ